MTVLANTQANMWVEPVQVAHGDIWQLGRHRIGCLDSTDKQQVKMFLDGYKPDIVFADPPYGINLIRKRRHLGKGNEYEPVLNDETPDTARAAYQLLQKIAPMQIWWGANHYTDILPPSSCWIVWDKQNGKSVDYADCELAWTNHPGVTRKFMHIWDGFRRDSERGIKRVHPNQKPIALAEWCFEKYGKEGDFILDPFLGSGITILAAEKTNRTVYGCELSPDYCAICIQRWQHATGQQAVKVSHATS